MDALSSCLPVLGILSFGDSLGRLSFKAGTFPDNCIDLLQCALEKAFLDATWRQSTLNFLLQKSGLGFQKQKNPYSCGYYVVAAVSTFADERDVHPNDDFCDYAGTSLTERYWRACFQSAMGGVRYCIKRFDAPQIDGCKSKSPNAPQWKDISNHWKTHLSRSTVSDVINVNDDTGVKAAASARSTKKLKTRIEYIAKNYIRCNRRP